jgi:hypothetical protein
MSSSHGWLYDWQDLIAGSLGFGAAIGAVIFTLMSERRKEGRELQSLKRTLVAEISQFATLALKSHERIKGESKDKHGITLHELEEVTRFTEPVIYLNNANRIGALGDHAHEIVLFFNRIQVLCAAVVRIQRDRIAAYQAYFSTIDPKNAVYVAGEGPGRYKIGGDNTGEVGEQLLIISENAANLLPHLAAGTIDDVPAKNFREATKKARAEWGANRYVESAAQH